jgi:hypothetical protein
MRWKKAMNGLLLNSAGLNPPPASQTASILPAAARILPP